MEEPMTSLTDITLANLKTMPTFDGVAWTATVLVKGMPKASIENLGNGGCSMFRPLDGSTYRDLNGWVREMDKVVAQALGRSDPGESFEFLLSATTEGMTAQDAVPACLKALA